MILIRKFIFRSVFSWVVDEMEVIPLFIYVTGFTQRCLRFKAFSPFLSTVSVGILTPNVTVYLVHQNFSTWLSFSGDVLQEGHVKNGLRCAGWPWNTRCYHGKTSESCSGGFQSSLVQTMTARLLQFLSNKSREVCWLDGCTRTLWEKTWPSFRPFPLSISVSPEGVTE